MQVITNSIYSQAIDVADKTQTEQEIFNAGIAEINSSNLEADNTERINLELREHQENVADWDFRLLMKEIHRWVGIFQFEFKLQLPQPAIGIDRLRKRIGGYFEEGRATFGTRDTIVLSELHLDGQFSAVLAILLHELIHEWQQHYGRPSKSHWYHNNEYRNKARECGLLLDQYGRNIDYTDIFNDTLSKYGVNFPSLQHLQRKQTKGGGSKLKKWSCSCRPPINIRCAVELDATCNRCHKKFRLAEATVLETLPLEANASYNVNISSEHRDDFAAKENQLQSENPNIEPVLLAHTNSDLVVSLGSKVKLLYDNDETADFSIVEGVYDNVKSISAKCPLAKAILGHKVGDEVKLVLEGHNTTRKVKIVTIEHSVKQKIYRENKIPSYVNPDYPNTQLIRTVPGFTSDGRKFDWFVEEKVRNSNWRLECIKAEVLGTERPLEVYRAIRKSNIVKPWTSKGAEEGYCPCYWADIVIGQGACGFRCKACFLILTHRIKCDPSRHVLYENIEDYATEVLRFLERPTRKNLGLGIDCSDSLLYEGVTGHCRRLIPLFSDPTINAHRCKLILLTKSTNVQYLEGLPTKNIILSFSLNPESVADIWEGKWNDGLRITPSIENRLTASLKGQNMGFEVRWRVDPIFPVSNWQKYYFEFFSNAAADGHGPTRITLGTYREMGHSLITFSKGWGLPPMEWKTSAITKDGSHYHISANERVAIYKFLKAAIEDAWKHTGHQSIVALCKETVAVRRATGITHSQCNCE